MDLCRKENWANKVRNFALNKIFNWNACVRGKQYRIGAHITVVFYICRKNFKGLCVICVIKSFSVTNRNHLKIIVIIIWVCLFL